MPWLNELVRRHIGYFKEWQERVATRQAYVTELATVLDAAWAATRQPFIVADLETTGLSANTDEVIEFAAILVTPDGGIADAGGEADGHVVVHTNVEGKARSLRDDRGDIDGSAVGQRSRAVGERFVAR